jgi:hypothetical protein
MRHPDPVCEGWNLSTEPPEVRAWLSDGKLCPWCFRPLLAEGEAKEEND